MVGAFRLEPEETLRAVNRLRSMESFEYTWPGAAGCLDDPIVAALVGLGDRLRNAIAATQAAIDELSDGARAAVVNFERAEREITDGLVAATTQIDAGSAPFAVPV